MSILSTDTCIRANQSGLGTASDGETYTINGTITTSIASNEAVVSGSSTFTSAILGTQTTADINFLVRVEQSSNNFDGVGPCWRSDASGQNCYFCAIYNGALLFAKLVNNGFTQLASVNVSEVSSVFYWIRATMTGNHCQARAWQDGNTEPSTWNIDTTDSTYTAAGRYGMSFNQFSGSGVKFDHITVTNGLNSLATLAQNTFKVRAALVTETRATFKIRAFMATQAHATWKIRAVLATLTRSTFKIDNVLTSLVTSAQATFKIKLGAVLAWITRDNETSWTARDNKATWTTRDNEIDWRTRD